MKVGELVTMLEDLNPEAEVVIYADHGQNPEKASVIDTMALVKYTDWEYNLKYLPGDSIEMGPEDIAQESEEWEECIVIYGQ